MVLWGGREKGASRKEGEKAGGLRCRERDNVFYVLSVQNLKFHGVHGVRIKKINNLQLYIYKHGEIYGVLNYTSRWLCVLSRWPAGE